MAILSILCISSFISTECKPIREAIKINTNNTGNNVVIDVNPIAPETSNKTTEDQFYIYYPLGIVNGSLSVVGSPIVYKVRNDQTNNNATGPSLEKVKLRRRKRQIGLNTVDALLGISFPMSIHACC